jgi:hypothetical protein
MCNYLTIYLYIIFNEKKKAESNTIFGDSSKFSLKKIKNYKFVKIVYKKIAYKNTFLISETY